MALFSTCCYFVFIIYNFQVGCRFLLKFLQRFESKNNIFSETFTCGKNYKHKYFNQDLAKTDFMNTSNKI
ncbi:hypothetical protein KUTeg_018438 [Tegillarca granosa]|uniref:Uncharacterized protein n=1 Tax=Tegillarca granosa TaxID=220873 RepID=A0ABQ9EMT6_TEGGR|nr:hypothetical protein KUTeg_018438 [Tegillarca granosa]